MDNRTPRSLTMTMTARMLQLACCLVALGNILAGAPSLITFHHDAGWCWFDDERALVQDQKLFIATVADGRTPDGSLDRTRRGHIEVTRYDLDFGESLGTTSLHENLEADDHNSPAMIVRPDGRILAVYAKHGPENRIYFRTTASDQGQLWQPERTFVPSSSSRITYSNLHFLSRENDGKGRVYNFFRGLDGTWKPSVMTSDDFGETWKVIGRLIDDGDGNAVRPYAKYVSDGTGRVHIVFTEGHPRNQNNSLYHIYYEAGNLHHSNGNVIQKLSDGPIRPRQATRIFAGNPNNVAWPGDVEIDTEGRPVVAYSVQKDGAGKPQGQGGEDHRYRYARWDGGTWKDQEIAYAGSRLYAGEDDYTGNVALDPDDANTIYISTNANPITGKQAPDSHYEIHRGVTRDQGRNWTWTPVTEQSKRDNIRPMIPSWNKDRTVVLWLQGDYHSYTDYDLDVVGVILD